MRDHLLAIYEQTGVMPAELQQDEPSLAVSHLLGYFQQLSTARQVGTVLNPLTFSEIMAWSHLMQIPLAVWEIEVIKQLDLVYLACQAEE